MEQTRSGKGQLGCVRSRWLRVKKLEGKMGLQQPWAAACLGHRFACVSKESNELRTVVRGAPPPYNASLVCARTTRALTTQSKVSDELNVG